MTHARQVTFPFAVRRSFAREDFDPGPSNERALALIETWPKWPARSCAIWGPQGSGKTHLAHIWLEMSGAREIPAASLDVAMIDTWVPGSAFLIDDADRRAGGAALFHLINFVRETDGWLLLTGREAPPRWPAEIPDLHSRLTAVPGEALDLPEETQLARVLLKLFTDRQLKLPEAFIDYLVPRLQRSFADAERLVALIDERAMQQKRKFSAELAREALEILDAQRKAGQADNELGLA